MYCCDILGSVLSPIIFFTITLIGCDATTTMVLLCSSQIAASAYYGGSLINNLDLASNFAGTLSGLTVTIIGIGSILAPIIVGTLTNNNVSI